MNCRPHTSTQLEARVRSARPGVCRLRLSVAARRNEIEQRHRETVARIAAGAAPHEWLHAMRKMPTSDSSRTRCQGRHTPIELWMVRLNTQICVKPLLSARLLTPGLWFDGYENRVDSAHDFGIVQFEDPAPTCLVIHVERA